MYSDCDDLIELADVWCSGHSHICNVNLKINGTPIYINCKGHAWENTGFLKDFTFDI